MRAAVTNKGRLLEVTKATLAILESGRFAESLVESGALEGPQASGTAKDIVVNALTASLDWARLESELEAAGGEIMESPEKPGQTRPYVPSNQVLSLMQSAYEEYLEEREAEIEEVPFDTSDPGWASVAWEKLKALFRGKREFIRHSSEESFRIELPENATVVLYSDWGTGEETARRVMREIRAANPTHAIHLGDIYYSGTKREVQKRFLDVIAAEGPGGSCRHFSLNANHDMYSGGYGYFDLALTQFGQPASYFNLRNQHWQLIGLDSGYEDHGLQDPQKDWLAAQLANGERKSILMTHHQFFSPYESRAFDRALHRKVKPLLEHVHAWFWGHEHRCIVFEEHMGIKARCVGHGAMPEEVPFGPARFPQIPVRAADERPAPGSNDEIRHGFAVLRFAGAALEVSYQDEFGAKFFQEML